MPAPRRASAAGAAARRELWRCSAHHFLNDGYAWALYPLLPLIASDFNLGYGASGAIKTALNLLLASLGLPFGLLAERLGELTVLTLGTVAYGVGLALVGGAWSYGSLLALVVVAGAGGAASHPVGSSLVSRRYAGGWLSSALGVLNFSGDVGKAVLPLAAAFLAARLGWRPALIILGLAGSVLAAVLHRVGPGEPGDSPRAAESPAPQADAAGILFRGSWGVRDWPAFISLNLVGILDSMPRSAVVVFTPFLLADRGISTGSVGAYLALLAAGGAAGKLGCGPLGDILGKRAAVVVTEVLTAVMILAAAYARGPWTALAFFVLGFFLNGTSSILYSLIPPVVSESRRSRGFGLYYTVTLLASGSAPLVYGIAADIMGLYPMMHLMSAMVVIAVPLSTRLGRPATGVGA